MDLKKIASVWKSDKKEFLTLAIFLRSHLSRKLAEYSEIHIWFHTLSSFWILANCCLARYLAWVIYVCHLSNNITFINTHMVLLIYIYKVCGNRFSLFFFLTLLKSYKFFIGHVAIPIGRLVISSLEVSKQEFVNGVFYFAFLFPLYCIEHQFIFETHAFP